MRGGLVRMALAVAFMISVFPMIVRNKATAQGFHQLTVSDFRGVPKPRMMGHIAYTNCTIDFKYTSYRDKDGTYKLYATVQLILNRDRCWLDLKKVTSQQMLNEVLNHEQGHYIIAYMQQQEILRQVNRTRFTANYTYEAKNLFNTIDAKYDQLNKDYEADTGNMQIREQQHSWDAYFAKRLNTSPPLAQRGY